MTRQENHSAAPTCTSPRRATWLGIAGEVWTYPLDSKRDGLRVAAHRWLEDNPNTGHSAGDLVLRLIEGDGRKTDFTEHDTTVVPAGTQFEADSYAIQCVLEHHR